jgi:hypothetical protein
MSCHHGTIMAWLCDAIDTNFIRALHPNMRCDIPITTNSFHNTVGPRHLWRNCMISMKQTLHYCLRKVIFRKVSGEPLLPIQVPKGEACSFVAIKKLAWFHVQNAKFSRFYICHDIFIDSFLGSRPLWYINCVVVWHSWYWLHQSSPP